ncbi:MFS transporter [Chthoniobacter flavus]|uniref:MFS transporter n=1 Tax=Chthoniobacter flavus TaxID=191863 RepID=UPI0002E8C19E|nr:MFS transporter [Chthoniobacter flavus]
MSSSTRKAWLVVALLWPVAMLNYLDRQMLATMHLSMQKDIVELQSNEVYGTLMGVFLWVYAFCSPLGGFVADRMNRKWLIVGSLGVWSSVTLLMGTAHDLTTLLWLRRAMGVSEALYIPAGLSLIADYHHGATRSLAIGIHMSGIYVGQALGGVGGWIAQEISWRTAFASCGCVGVAYGIVLAFFLREKEDRGAVTTSPELRADGGGPSVAWVGYIILILCFALPSLPGWAVKNWLPTLLQERFFLDEKSSGLWATISHSGAAFLGVVVGGRLSDYLFKRSVYGRTWVSASGLFLKSVVIIGLGLAPGFGFVIVCSALYGFGFGLFDANSMPILCQVAPPRFRATGYGLMNFFGTAAGALITPYLGKLKDNGTPFAVSFAYCAIPALLAAILMILLRPRDRDRGVAA